MADVDQTIKALLSNYRKNKNKRKRELSSRLTDKREVLQEQDEKLKYHVCQGGRRRKTTVECQTIPLVKEPEIIIGRDEDKHLLISELLKEDREGHMSYFPFIVITGTAGIGKTTLAQLIYNDAQVEKRFENRIWASISGEFDENKVVEAINESAMGEHAGLITVKHLDAVLKEKITLIVLDNIIDDHQWPFESEANMRSLISIFERMGKGSKIIIITTFKKKTSVDIPSKNQAKSVGRYSTWKYHLNALSPDDSWSIFSSRAFIGRTSEERSELEGIGREIVQLCKGVPLALKTLASALQSMETKSEWELILESDLWDSKTDFLPALLLSYCELPTRLNNCFSFCSVVSKETSILKDRLIKMWMAQGLLYSYGDLDMEDIGEEFFNELLGRSFFYKAKRDEFKMHDMIHDLAKLISNESNLAHHHVAEKILRTIITQHESIAIQPDQWICVRVLDLSETSLENLPDSVASLSNLRYLDLSHSKIKQLPESVSNHGTLQTLLLHCCSSLCKLPSGIGKMIGLRHLDIGGTNDLMDFPAGFGSLTSLRELSYFIAGRKSGCKIGELKELDLLRGHLTIYNLEAVANREEASEAKLMNKKFLQSLVLSWNDDENATKNDEVGRSMEGALEGLQPHTNLEVLEISGYLGFMIPSWVEDPIFSNLVNVGLYDCENCRQLPALGKLPSLKYLNIFCMHQVRSIGEEFYGVKGAFPKLEGLYFHSMYNWERWDLSMEDGVMPSLRKLYIKDCPMLYVLPKRLPNLLQLKIDYCLLLTRACRIGEEDWEKISHIPIIVINGENIQSRKGATDGDPQ